jgi:hypothetical protein
MVSAAREVADDHEPSLDMSIYPYHNGCISHKKREGPMSDDKYARTTISLPPEVKAQMEMVEEPVNWSAVACRAFEDKLAEIAAQKEKKDMSDIVARLRASKRQSEDTHYKEGFEVGREWAGDTAEAEELQRLESFAEDRVQYRDWDANLVVSAVWPDEDDRYAVENFWEQALGDNTSAKDDSSFVKGFVEGALALWHEVKKQL